jgi:hypothetical protein
MSVIKLIKRLLKRPDVLLEGSHGEFKIATSRMLGKHRVVYWGRDDFVILKDDGTVRGTYVYRKWEAL